MVSKKNTVVGLGELLWDLFPEGKKLGGAPANFAYITSLLGDEGIPASRLASIVFPEPGGPMSSTLCAPAAATSRARLAVA